jgi:hypothetical protein
MGMVMLSAWVRPEIRDLAREHAKRHKIGFSEFIEEAVRRAVSDKSAEEALDKISKRESATALGFE